MMRSGPILCGVSGWNIGRSLLSGGPNPHPGSSTRHTDAKLPQVSRRGLQKGDVNLDHGSIDWSNQEELDVWLRAVDAIEQGLMPPPDQKQPSREDRGRFWLFLIRTS